jgi:hypothetical protein
MACGRETEHVLHALIARKTSPNDTPDEQPVSIDIHQN